MFMIFLDVTNAFDGVSHRNLLVESKGLGIDRPAGLVFFIGL